MEVDLREILREKRREMERRKDPEWREKETGKKRGGEVEGKDARLFWGLGWARTSVCLYS